MALTLHSYFKEGYRLSRKRGKKSPMRNWKGFSTRKPAAGRKTATGWQDTGAIGMEPSDVPARRNAEMDPGAEPETDELKGWGHCGCCTICHAFGYSKNKVSKTRNGLFF